MAATYPIQVHLMTFSGLVNRHQADVISYLVEENRILKLQLKWKALRLTDDQRRSLAAKAKLLGRKVLSAAATCSSFVEHYHAERSHQGLGNELILHAADNAVTGPVLCRERQGGLLKHYYRAAA